jgi:hypothetical protein
VFVSVPLEVGETFTSIVTGGYAPAAATGSVRVHVSVPSVQFQPAPLIAVARRPAGNESTIVTAALVAEVPMFETMIVYCSPTCPATGDPACVFVTARSATGVIAVDSDALSFALAGSITPPLVAIDPDAVMLAPVAGEVTTTGSVADEKTATVATLHVALVALVIVHMNPPPVALRIAPRLIVTVSDPAAPTGPLFVTA